MPSECCNSIAWRPALSITQISYWIQSTYRRPRNKLCLIKIFKALYTECNAPLNSWILQEWTSPLSSFTTISFSPILYARLARIPLSPNSKLFNLFTTGILDFSSGEVYVWPFDYCNSHPVYTAMEQKCSFHLVGCSNIISLVNVEPEMVFAGHWSWNTVSNTFPTLMVWVWRFAIPWVSKDCEERTGEN